MDLVPAIFEIVSKYKGKGTEVEDFLYLLNVRHWSPSLAGPDNYRLPVPIHLHMLDYWLSSPPVNPWSSLISALSKCEFKVTGTEDELVALLCSVGCSFSTEDEYEKEQPTLVYTVIGRDNTYHIYLCSPRVNCSSLRTGGVEAGTIRYKVLPPGPVEKCWLTRRVKQKQVTTILVVGKTGVGKSSILSRRLVSGNSCPAAKDQPEKRQEAEKGTASFLEYSPDGSNCVVLVSDPHKFATKDTSVIIIDTSGASESVRLFLSSNLSKIDCPIVTFPVDLTKATNETITELKKLGLGKKEIMHVLMAVSTSCCNDVSTGVEENQKMKLILLEQRLLSSHAGSSQQSRISRELIIEFVTTLEGQLQRGLVPHSDAKMVTLLPFRADMRDYLPNMSFLVLQVSFPVSLLKKRIALLLLASRVLYTSLEDSLAEVMCEDQALVMQRSSAFLVTENHAIEALIQFSQLQNVFWYIVSYNSEKCSMEMMEKVQDTLQQNFRDEFPSREFSIEPLNTCQQQPSNESTEPKEIQQIKTAVEESQSDSGQIYLLVTVNTKFVEPEPGMIYLFKGQDTL